jgi:peptidyl-prolyl cis-trans isomerase SurA
MIRIAGPTPADSAAARSQAEGLKARLDAGEDFSALAAEHSADTYTAPNGGELQRIKYDTGLPPSMRDVAYSLNQGEISDVVESPFGFHIMKLWDVYPIDSFEDSYEDIQTKIAQLPRAKSAEDQGKRAAREKYEVTIDTDFLIGWAASYDGTSDVSDADSMLQIITVAPESRTLLDFIEYHRTSPSVDSRISAQTILPLVDDYVSDIVFKKEIRALEGRDEEFAATMTEFRRGLLLFRLMEDSVWTAASTDSLGLAAYYEMNSDSYRYGDRTRVISFSVQSDSVAQGVVADIRATNSVSGVLAALSADSLSTTRVDTTYIEGETGSIYDQIQSLSEGSVTEPIPYNSGYIVLYHGGVDPARLRTFSEARALVVNDYQEVLNERLLERLHKKYMVASYPEALNEYFEDPAN